MFFSSQVPNCRLGETIKGTDPDSNLINTEILGKFVTFHNYGTKTNGVYADRTGGPVVAVALRNASGVTLYGKRVVKLDIAAGKLMTQVLGYASVLAEGPVAVIDDLLASNGVANNDIFWAVVSGNQLLTTPDAGAAQNGNITAGAGLVAATAAASTSTTGGRVSNVTIDTSTVGNTANCSMALNCFATAISSRTTGETASDILAKVHSFRLM